MQIYFTDAESSDFQMKEHFNMEILDLLAISCGIQIWRDGLLCIYLSGNVGFRWH